MKYYFYNELGNVTLIYYVAPPTEELKKKHIKSDVVFEDRQGFSKQFSVNLQTLELVCDYIKIPPTTDEKIIDIEKANVNQDKLIDVSLLATDEIYTMIEPLLNVTPQKINLRGGSKMVDMYVAMVQRGLKTIDEVPARYREQVKEILAKLEK